MLAKKLLFANTEAGDLTRFISGFFDTTVGAKKDVESYRHIATEIKVPPDRIMFVSDAAAELDAAAAASLKILLCVRPGNNSQPCSHSMIESFDQIP